MPKNDGGPVQVAEPKNPYLSYIPGITGSKDPKAGLDYANKAETSLDFTPFDFNQSKYAKPLADSLLNPSFAPSSEAEQNLLDTIMSQTHGASAYRGLGPSSQEALASSIAPTLVEFNQRKIANIMAALGLDYQTGLTARGQDLSANQAKSMLELQLANLASPQPVITEGQLNTGGGDEVRTGQPVGAPTGTYTKTGQPVQTPTVDYGEDIKRDNPRAFSGEYPAPGTPAYIYAVKNIKNPSDPLYIPNSARLSGDRND